MKVLKSMTFKTVGVMLGLAMFTLTSCKNEPATDNVEDTTIEENAGVEEEAASEINDAQIAHIVVTANQIDVDYGKVALEKSENEDVRHFAQTMIQDHEAIIKSASDLAEKLGVTPEDNPTSQSLLEGQKVQNEAVSGLTGLEYDKAYINNEVAYHEAVIDAVKTVLIPNTQNEELKGALESVMPNLEHHLEMAKEARERINQL